MLSGLVFWKSTERLTNWGDHPTHKKGNRSEWASLYRSISLFNLQGKVFVKCLDKRCRETNEPKLKDSQCGFRPGRSTTDQIFTLQQIFENHGSMPTTSTHFLSTSRKHMSELLVKSFGDCCESTVLTAACYWSSSHCIPAQKFVSVSGSYITTVHRWCWTLARVCALTTPLHSLYELDRSHSRVEECVTVGSCRINCLLFADDLVLLASSQQGFSMHSIDFLLRATGPEWKLAPERPRCYVSLEQCFLTFFGFVYLCNRMPHLHSPYCLIYCRCDNNHSTSSVHCYTTAFALLIHNMLSPCNKLATIFKHGVITTQLRKMFISFHQHMRYLKTEKEKKILLA